MPLSVISWPRRHNLRRHSNETSSDAVLNNATQLPDGKVLASLFASTFLSDDWLDRFLGVRNCRNEAGLEIVPAERGNDDDETGAPPTYACNYLRRLMPRWLLKLISFSCSYENQLSRGSRRSPRYRRELATCRGNNSNNSKGLSAKRNVLTCIRNEG